MVVKHVDVLLIVDQENVVQFQMDVEVRQLHVEVVMLLLKIALMDIAKIKLLPLEVH